MKLKYDDLNLSYYTNTTLLGSLGGEDIVLHDMVTAELFAGLNFFFRGKEIEGTEIEGKETKNFILQLNEDVLVLEVVRDRKLMTNF